MPQPIEIHIHLHIGGDRDDEIVGLQHQLLRAVRGIETKEQLLTINVEALTAAVAEETTVDQGIVTLLNQLSGQLADEPAAQAAIDAAVAQIQANTAPLAAALTANTPVDTGGGETPESPVDPVTGTPATPEDPEPGSPVGGGVPVDGDGNAQAADPDAPVV